MATDSHPSFVTIGYIDRVHGLDGELKLIWDIDHPLVVLEQENPVVFFKNIRGDFYPVRVSSFRVEKKKNSQTFFVIFDQYNSRSTAETLKNHRLYVDKGFYDSLIKPSESTTENYVDYKVLDMQGRVIGSVQPHNIPSVQPLIQVATTKGSLLIPLVEPYLASIDTNSHQIVVSNLENLIEE